MNEYEKLAARIMVIMRETADKANTSKLVHDIYITAAEHAAEIVRKYGERKNDG